MHNQFVNAIATTSTNVENGQSDPLPRVKI